MPTIIEIRTFPRFSLRYQVMSFCVPAGLIGVGVAVGSAAMEWAGFLTVAMISIGLAMVATHKDKGLTIPEARKRLDEIEAREIGK